MRRRFDGGWERSRHMIGRGRLWQVVPAVWLGDGIGTPMYIMTPLDVIFGGRELMDFVTRPVLLPLEPVHSPLTVVIAQRHSSPATTK